MEARQETKDQKRETEDHQKYLAQVGLKPCSIVPGQVYRHYKGGLYVIVAVSIKEDTLEPMVTYRSNKRGTCWARTLANFSDKVGHSAEAPLSDPFVPRFTMIED